MSAFKAGQTVWRHKTQLVRGCAERAAKLTGPIQEILQSGYGSFRLKRIAWAGLGSLKIGNRHNIQYNPTSFPNRAETAAKRVLIRIRTDFNFAGVPFSGSLKAGFSANLPSPTRNTP